jgi:hypothetical protein
MKESKQQMQDIPQINSEFLPNIFVGWVFGLV